MQTRTGTGTERQTDLLGIDVIIGELRQKVLEGDTAAVSTFVALSRLFSAIAATERTTVWKHCRLFEIQRQ